MYTNYIKANGLFWLVAFFFILLFIPIDLAGQKKRTNRPVVKRGNIATVTAKVEPKYSEATKLRVAAFYEVWSAIKQNYYDPKFSGLDWDRIRREYEPKAISAKSDAELHALLSRMVGLLKRSHLEITAPEVYQTIASTKRAIRRHEIERNAKPGEKTLTDIELEEADFEEEDTSSPDRFGLGVDLKLIDNRFILTRIDAGSSSEKAGLKLGQAVEKINGVSLQLMLDRVVLHYDASKLTVIKNYLASEIVE